MSQEVADHKRSANDGKEASVEVELKFLVKPKDLAVLASAPVIERYARNGGTVRNLRSVYFDTPERRLWNAGWTLRVRKSGSRHVMTVKSLGSSGGGMIGRSEWEAPVRTMDPDLAALPEEVPDAFRKAVEGADLAAVLNTQVKRRARKLDLPDACIELAVDSGEIIAGARREALSEIELELVSGRVGALYDIGLELLDLAPVEMSLYSKAARGFDLTLDRPPSFKKPGGADLPSGVDLDEAFAGMARSGARDLLIDLRGNPGGDASFSDLIVARLVDEPFRHSSRYEIRAGANTKRIWQDREIDSDTLGGKVGSAIAAARVGERVAIELPSIEPIDENAFEGRVWLLVDKHSYSNAAVVAALMQDLDIATIMGEETADLPTTYGAVERFSLPNSGASIVYPKAYMVRPSGSEEVRGVVPEYPIAPNPIGEKRDLMLEAALTQIRAARR